MNGLEAIELMKQGKMVVCKNRDDAVINKIIDGSVCFVYEHLKDGSEWEVDDCFDFTKSYEEYIEPKSLTGWERVEEGERYRFLHELGYHVGRETCAEMDYHLYNSANYFSTFGKMKEIMLKQTLFRKLQRFSDENGGNEIDWNDADQTKYGIVYETKVNAVSVRVCTVQRFGEVYFQSYEAAKEAARLLKDDLIKYFTHDWSGENE